MATSFRSMPNTTMLFDSSKKFWFRTNIHAHIAQQAEATDLKSVKCGFESHYGHQLENVMDYTIKVFKKDNRRKDGVRLVKEIECPDYSGNAVSEEVRYLRRFIYKVEDGYKVVW